jgi:hypothetical protein
MATAFMTRRFLPALVSIIALCSVAAAGAYLLYRSHTSARDAPLMEIAESIEWRQAPLQRCLTMIRQEDSYALFEDNKRRIEGAMTIGGCSAATTGSPAGLK